jgi:AraC-like DNA-binding protein
MSHPLASFAVARTSDADEAQSVLSRELSELRFKSVRNRSRFQFEMNGIRLGRTMVAFNHFSTESVVDADVVETAVIVSLSVGPAAVLHLDGESVGPGRLAIVSPSRRLTVHRAPGSGVLVLRAGLEAIEERFRELTGKELTRSIIFDRSVDLEQGVGAQIRRLLAYLVDDSENTDTILNNRLLRTQLDDMLLGAILALPSNVSDVLHGGREVQAAPLLVRRAEQFLEAHATEPITISDVVAECSCSRRALFHAFRQHRGYTPLQFLAEARLKSARNAMLCSSPTDTVTSIALACGFSHLGRFAEAYRKRFAEKPSETMRKA